jgi:alpha-acetolactate decarboxylase
MTDGEFIAIDGKTARGSSDRSRAKVSEDNR